MERIKLAILKAKESAGQRPQEPPHVALVGSSALSAAASAVSKDRGADHAGRHAGPGRRSWPLAGTLLLGLAAVLAFWAVKRETGATSMPSAMQAEAAPVPPAPVAAPMPTSEPALPDEGRNAVAESAVAPAVAAASTEPSTATVPPQDDQVVAAVETWRQAWAKRDMSTYLDAYSDAFTPPDGMSREDWIASRYRNVGGRKSIDVQIQRLLVQSPEEGRARVSFLQDYRSGSVREVGQSKTLDLVKGTDNRWRIVGEWRGDPPPSSGAGKS
jgi:hypothetical protein